jgi:hypothetical protein
LRFESFITKYQGERGNYLKGSMNIWNEANIKLYISLVTLLLIIDRNTIYTISTINIFDIDWYFLKFDLVLMLNINKIKKI